MSRPEAEPALTPGHGRVEAREPSADPSVKHCSIATRGVAMSVPGRGQRVAEQSEGTDASVPVERCGHDPFHRREQVGAFGDDRVGELFGRTELVG